VGAPAEGDAVVGAGAAAGLATEGERVHELESVTPQMTRNVRGARMGAWLRVREIASSKI